MSTIAYPNPATEVDATPVERVIIGVDTHKDFHVAAALDERGALLGVRQFAATSAGYDALRRWVECGSDTDAGLPARTVVYGIEGTSSYGAGLVAALRPTGSLVLEVGRPNRRDRRLRGKTDAYDAENAARPCRDRHGPLQRPQTGTSR